MDRTNKKDGKIKNCFVLDPAKLRVSPECSFLFNITFFYPSLTLATLLFWSMKKIKNLFKRFNIIFFLNHCKRLSGHILY